MALTMKDVIQWLLPDEANLNRAAAILGAEALPHLAELVDGDDLMLASKATWVAGMIPDPRGAEIVLRAAKRSEKVMRVAAALVADKMPPERTGAILTTLLRDEDAETRGMAINAVKPESPQEVVAALSAVANEDQNAYLRGRSEEALRRCSR